MVVNVGDIISIQKLNSEDKYMSSSLIVNRPLRVKNIFRARYGIEYIRVRFCRRQDAITYRYLASRNMCIHDSILLIMPDRFII